MKTAAGSGCRSVGRLGWCLGLALALAGCAAGPRSAVQTVAIEAVTPLGVAVDGARCSARNNLGDWTLVAPGRLSLTTDGSPLDMLCEADAGRGELRVPASVRGGRGGRALAGAGIGLAVGGLIGRGSEPGGQGNACCTGVSTAVGVVLGTVIGLGIGAGTADPRHAYPERVRVVLRLPDAPSSLPVNPPSNPPLNPAR